MSVCRRSSKSRPVALFEERRQAGSVISTTATVTGGTTGGLSAADAAAIAAAKAAS